MDPVESAQTQTPPAPPVESAQVEQQTPVTAAGSTPADNATPPQQTTQGPPQDAGGGQTVAVVDDEPKGEDAYDKELSEFLSSSSDEPKTSVLEGLASPADLAAQGLPPKTEAQAAPTTTPSTTETTQPVPSTAVPPVPEDDLEPGTGKQPRFNNVRAVDPVDVQALAAYKAAQKSGTLGGKNMVQFMADFAAKAGSPGAPQTQQTATEPTTAPAGEADLNREPSTVAEAEALIDQLITERYRKNDAFEWDEAAALERRQKKVESMLQGLRDNEKQEHSERQTAVQAADQNALNKVATMYPQAVNPADPLVAKFSEIVAGWEESGDPRLNMENRYLYAYMEAAEALQIQPNMTAPAAPAPQPSVQPSSPTPPVNRPPTSAILASGGARDIPRAPVSSNPEDYDTELSAFLGKQIRTAA